ncbi:DUF4381 domain-containing protein [Photobacterium sp.]|uniref:DUF4381 domain-containing protein n=1 Tax=Photobacterium sp. TaxID=660 RepID=UPI00299ED2EC|nr:DUF4381 domain-containing protein [Photobacterium sp.]MDX1303254.1 DUF4381 domain-containing protein [Photobacterium sp.]
MATIHTPPSTYILRDLHDVTVPESVSWWPQTIGWKLLALVALLVLAYLTYKALRHWWSNRYRSEALTVLNELNPQDDYTGKRLFSVLKIVLVYLDSGNACLFDMAFLDKLNELSPEHPAFNDQTAKQWQQSLVNPSIELNPEQNAELIKRAKVWLEQHSLSNKTQEGRV